jgi:hypothetical protein
MDSAANPCTCWTMFDELPLADIKAVMAAADLSVG